MFEKRWIELWTYFRVINLGPIKGSIPATWNRGGSINVWWGIESIKIESQDNGAEPRVYGGIFKYNRPIKPMCQLWGEFIEIYVKTDVEGFQYYIKKSRKESRRPKKSWSKDNCAESSKPISNRSLFPTRDENTTWSLTCDWIFQRIKSICGAESTPTCGDLLTTHSQSTIYC